MGGFRESLPAPTFLAEVEASPLLKATSSMLSHTSALLNLCMGETVRGTHSLKVPASKLKLEGILRPILKFLPKDLYF